MSEKELLMLPHQFELLSDTTTKIIGLCSGYGGGKTWSAARKAVHLAILNPGVDGIITEPTFPLLTQVMFPELKSALEFFNVQYKFNKVESIFYCNINGHETRIICGSMENYERLIGINAAWCICDEFDTSKTEVAYNAYVKLLGRLRKGNVRQMVIVSTPEGFRAMHKIFVLEKDDSKKLIQARTQDNKYLPIDYIETLRSQYPQNLLQAYLEGQFVNLTSGTVYSSYDRVKCDSDETIQPGEPLYIGCDFNVTKQAATVYVKRGEVWHAVDELVDMYDTPDMVRTIKNKYAKHVIYVYPDASGGSRKTVDASISDIALLQQAKFIVKANKRNPAVKDRILATNAALDKGLVKINSKKCPIVSQCLEQQAYNKNGEPDKSSDNDHQNDATTYPIAFEMPIIKPVANLNVKFAM
jgi:PBSX family phage terminase large subunit